jgi:hypothetical protein
MGGINRKKCRNCHALFKPNLRNKKRQKYCSKPECRKASKTESQQKWLQQSKNRDYFRGSSNVLRVQEWRKAHPGYWRQKPKDGQDALQDLLIPQRTGNTKNKFNFATGALQDFVNQQPAVLIGLIAQITGCALQDDIALAARRMQRLGNDILNPITKGDRHGKTPHLPGTGPKNPPTIQLGGPSPGP